MAAAHDIVVIGASAGGVEALSQIVQQLPSGFPAAVFVTLHFPANAISVLPSILGRAGNLPVEHASDHQRIVHGRVYVAPPDHHLLLFPGVLRVVRGPKENGNRPAVDPMFRSAAVAYGSRVIGIVLTGNLDDGTAGLLAIKRRGGTTIVQDPADALFPAMPASALEHVDVDHIVNLDELPSLLCQLVVRPTAAGEAGPVTKSENQENAYSAMDLRVIESPEEHPGQPSAFSCPDCGGVLWQIDDGDLVRYRCRIGHGWTTDGLANEQIDTLDAALWTALRALEESAALSHQLAQRLERRGNAALVERYLENARTARQRAALVRQVLLSGRTFRDVEADDRQRETSLAESER